MVYLLLLVEKWLIPFSFVMVLFCCIYVTFFTRAIQLRSLFKIFSLFFQKKKKPVREDQITPRQALFTSMSTVVGLGNISGPVIAIQMGGAPALAGFLLTSLFGSAITFVEVSLALSFRKKGERGRNPVRGAMIYIERALSSRWAQFYAFCLMILLMFWSGSQANILAGILEGMAIPTWMTGLLLLFPTAFVLVGGAKRIARLSERIVPVMFLLYIGSMITILWLNQAQLPGALSLIFFPFRKGVFSKQMHLGALLSALHWGVARALQSNECGVGTASIIHSMVDSSTPPHRQGILAMLSVYVDVVICLLTGLVILVTGVQEHSLSGHPIAILFGLFQDYFPTLGPLTLSLSAFLFAFGTTLGNSYNSQVCFQYLFRPQRISIFYLLILLCIFAGSITHVSLIFKLIDVFILPIVTIHLFSIIYLIRANPQLVCKKSKEKV